MLIIKLKIIFYKIKLFCDVVVHEEPCGGNWQGSWARADYLHNLSENMRKVASVLHYY